MSLPLPLLALLLIAPVAALGQPRVFPAVPVTTTTVERAAVPVAFPANGTATAEGTVTIRARLDGQIERVHVAEGQMVKRGDLLFTLDSRLFAATLAQQEAQLARDRANQARTEADRARYAALRGEGFAAAQRNEQAQADALVAAANVRATEAQLDYTRTQIAYATITAEVDGRLGQIPLREGNVLRAAEATVLATITPMDPLIVRFVAPERFVPELRAALASASPPTVRAAAPNDSGPPVDGVLTFMDSQVDAQTGTIALAARFPNESQRLWPGQWVNLSVTLRQEDGLVVPVQAVQRGQQGQQIFVLDAQGVAHRRAVQVARIVAGRAVVTGAVAQGDRVVVEGANLLTDGARAIERAPGGTRS